MHKEKNLKKIGNFKHDWFSIKYKTREKTFKHLLLLECSAGVKKTHDIVLKIVIVVIDKALVNDDCIKILQQSNNCTLK